MEHQLKSVVSPQFGGETLVEIDRTGDLVYGQYVQLEIPGLFPLPVHGMKSRYPAVLSGNCFGGGEGNYMPAEELATGLSNPLGGYYCHWVNGVGYKILKQVTLVIGGQTIETLDSDYMYMWDELSGAAGKRMRNMVGRYDSREQLIAHSRKPQTLYVPLPFWYNKSSGHSLALAALAFHHVNLNITFEALSNLIIVSNQDIQVNVSKSVTSNYVGTSPPVPTVGDDSGIAIANSDLAAKIVSNYMYLDVEERGRFSASNFQALVSLNSHKSITTSADSVELDLNFSHPVSELIWSVQLKANADANKHFDYSRVGPAAGGTGALATTSRVPQKPAILPQAENTFDVLQAPETVVDDENAGLNLITAAGAYGLADVVTVDADPLKTVDLRINSTKRFPETEAKFFRTVQPAMHHTNIPQAYIYSYSFALHPEDNANPSGSLNFSRIDTAKLDMVFHDDLCTQSTQKIVRIYARYWNVFNYADGIGGVRFS